jgi:penicillin amidase
MRQILKRLTISLLILLLLVMVGGGGWLYWRARASLPQLEGAIQVAGLAAPVEVWRDARAVPHLRASWLDDLFFAQGYVTAQDRLWQMDLSRRLAEGELSEVFGEQTLRLDIENRTLGLRQVSVRALAELSPEARAPLAAYANGVNAFINSHEHRLAIEFLLLHYRPRAWMEADSLAVALNMAKTLNTTWRTDLMREGLRAKLGPELSADLLPDHSALDEPVAELPPESKVSPQKRPVYPPSSCFDLDPSVLDEPVAGLAGTPGKTPKQSFPSSEMSRVGPASCGPATDPSSAPSADGLVKAPSRPVRSPWERAEPFAMRSVSDLTADPTLAALLSSGDSRDANLGSNNWVVSGEHTQSGKPLLANDPHLDHSVPSVWYMIHLKGPGLNVSGVSLPGMPLVVIGHNEKIAWGMTNTGPDVQDLYAESFDPAAPNKYLHNGAWVDAEVRNEVIKVRRRPDYRLTVKVTRHGPIVSESCGRDLALRWTALEPHALSTLFNSVPRMDLAQNWEQFTAALRDYTGPMQNFVYADVEGNIGYYAAAWVPIRKRGTGAVPAPGSTDDYDWTGYIPFEDLPHSYDPASGTIATANGRVVPDGYPYFITSQWDPPFRTARIFQLLRAGKSFTVDDMLRIQTDIVTLEDKWLAGQLLQAASHGLPQDPDARYALSLLSHWDGEARMDSAATLVCEVTRQALLERLLKPKLGDGLARYHWGMSTIFLENVLANNWTRWLPPGDPSFADTLMKSLEAGVKQIPSRVGSRSHDAWKWGNAVLLTFYHPLGQGLPLLGRVLDVGPFPQAGTATTVKATTSRHGPSMRMVVDLSSLDNSVQNITLGESGQVFSPYYKDQFDAWYNGRSFPTSFSDAAVEQATVHKLVLGPEKK